MALKPLPLTDADRAAWFDWQINRRRDWQVWGALERLSFAADSRDAELMLEYEWKRRHGFGTSPLRREICRWSQL